MPKIYPDHPHIDALLSLLHKRGFRVLFRGSYGRHWYEVHPCAA